MNRLKKKYQTEIAPVFKKEFAIVNQMALPKIKKVVINVGVGQISSDKTALKKAADALAKLTGQKPSKRRAKKAISDFQIREGQVVGLKVTLRKKRMYHFLDKLFTIVLPRMRDFSGVSRQSFDHYANYTLGLSDQLIFPEVDYDKIDRVRGLEITIVTTTKEKKKALRLLELLGMPFTKEDKEDKSKDKGK